MKFNLSERIRGTKSIQFIMIKDFKEFIKVLKLSLGNQKDTNEIIDEHLGEDLT